jgi:hypothetical protein
MVRYDAKSEIMTSLGDITGIELFGTQVIIAPYIHSGVLWSSRLEIPADSVLSSDNMAELIKTGKGLVTHKLSVEDIFQGKVALVVKIGLDVDVSDPKYGDNPLKIGDWVFSLQENTRGVSLCGPGAIKSQVLGALNVDYTGYPCKLIYSSDIYGRVSDPNVLV